MLEALAAVTPPWSLTGGGALAGFHLRHRTTRDLDLFWHGQRALGDEVERSIRAAEAAGFQVAVLQRAPAFARLRVADADDAVIVDLVAEPVACAHAPQSVAVGAHTIRIDTADEILANKLGALLRRSELRDLIDIEGLLRMGCPLAPALAVAARKDGGFSAATLGWALQGFPVQTQGELGALSPGRIAELVAFCSELARAVATAARPD